MFWNERLAEVCHLRPCDLNDMTLQQIHSAHLYAHPDEG